MSINKTLMKAKDILRRYQGWKQYLGQEEEKIGICPFYPNTIENCMTCRGCTGCKGCYGSLEMEITCIGCTAPGCKGCSAPGCRGCGSCRG